MSTRFNRRELLKTTSAAAVATTTAPIFARNLFADESHGCGRQEQLDATESVMGALGCALAAPSAAQASTSTLLTSGYKRVMIKPRPPREPEPEPVIDLPPGPEEGELGTMPEKGSAGAAIVS